MKLGMINRLTVIRETEISYILTDGSNEVFLHKKEAKKPYMKDEEIDVFLYTDNQGRITASTKTPIIEIGQIGLLDVVSINYDYGVFVYNGLVKDLLLSKDDLPYEKEKWPRIGDHLFVGIKEEKERLFAYLPSRNDIHKFFIELEPLGEGTILTAYCQKLTKEGIVCYTEFGHEIFVHNNNFREQKRFGETVEVKVLKMTEDNKYTGTLIEQKELMLEKDAIRIYEYLQEHGGEMPYTDKTNKDIISDVFHMSKSAFKRGLGSLYKARKIVLEKNLTKIIDK